MKLVFGIDPGKEGGLAALVDQGSILSVEAIDMPDSPAGIVHFFEQYKHPDKPIETIAYLEKVSAMPNQGVVSMFTFGTGFGVIQGILAALKIPYTFVTPAKWQKATFDSMKCGDTKKMSLDLARRLYPTVDLHKKGDHGKSDALLIATYGVRQNTKL